MPLTTDGAKTDAAPAATPEEEPVREQGCCGCKSRPRLQPIGSNVILERSRWCVRQPVSCSVAAPAMCVHVPMPVLSPRRTASTRASRCAVRTPHRRCTDIHMLLVFIAFWAGMCVVTAPLPCIGRGAHPQPAMAQVMKFAWDKGDQNKILYGYDWKE